MKLFLTRCAKFRFLLNEAEDRILSAGEASFLACHEEVCGSCSRIEASSEGLNLLRAASLEPRVSEGFTDRTVRLIQVQSVRTSMSYWLPAIAGGVIACLALVSALQMIARPTGMPMFMNSDAESRRIEVSEPLIPSLDLKGSPARRDP